MKLYELSAEYEAAKADMQEQGFDESTIKDTLDGISEDIEEKLEKVALYRKGLDAEKEAISKEIERLQARKKSIDTEQDWLKNYMFTNMKQCGLDKVKTAKVTISIVKPRKVLELAANFECPESYEVVKKSVDKRALVDAIKAGSEIKGASLVDGQESLRVS